MIADVFRKGLNSGGNLPRCRADQGPKQKFVQEAGTMRSFYKALKGIHTLLMGPFQSGGLSDELMVGKPVRVVVRSRR